MLLKEGHTVYCTARRVERMNDLKQLGAFINYLDVTDITYAEKCINNIITEQGRIDVLLNNAGYGLFGSVEDVPLSAAKQQFDVNVFGMTEISKIVVPFMRSQGGGRIINMSSAGGRFCTPMGAWYHGSKFAVEGISDCMRYELKKFNIDVVLIEPGGIATEWYDVMNDNMSKFTDEKLYGDMMRASANTMNTGKKFMSSPDVVAKAVCKAVNSRHPKTRYAVGFMAKPGIFAREILPTKIFDAFMRMFFKEKFFWQR